MQPKFEAEGNVVDSWEDAPIEQQLERLAPPSKTSSIHFPNSEEKTVVQEPASTSANERNPKGPEVNNRTDCPAPGDKQLSAVPLIEELEDPFLVEALQTQRKRLTVLKIEMELRKFINSQLAQLEFSPNLQLNAYQRLGIHRVAFYLGLQSSVVRSEDGDHTNPGKIIVRKVLKTHNAIPLSEYKTSEEAIKAASKAVPRVMAIKRRENKPETSSERAESPFSSDKGALNSKTVEERTEDYHRTREQIFSSCSDEFRVEEDVDGTGTQGQDKANAEPSTPDDFKGSEDESSRSGSRNNSSSNLKRSEGSTGSAILRDREKDRLDPDFDRSAERFGPQFTSSSYFDNDDPYYPQSRYQPVTYNTEFPSLGGGPSVQPPMPPHPPPLPQGGVVGGVSGGGGVWGADFSQFNPPLPPGSLHSSQPPLPPHLPPGAPMPPGPMIHQVPPPPGMDYRQFQGVPQWGDSRFAQQQQPGSGLGGPWMMMMQPPPPPPHPGSHGNLLDLQGGSGVSVPPVGPVPGPYMGNYAPMGMQWHAMPRPPLPQGAPMFYQQQNPPPPLPPNPSGSPSLPQDRGTQ